MNVFLEITTWYNAYKLMRTAINNGIVYVNRNKAIGDVLWTEPVMRTLAASGKQYIFVTHYPEVFENFPYKNVRFINRADKKYKRAVKLLKAFKHHENLIDLDRAYEKDTQKHFLHAYQKVAGLPLTNEYPRLYLTEEENERYKAIRPYVVIHLESFSIWNYRNVYGIEWQIIIDYLHNNGYKVIVLAKAETNYKNALYLPTDLRGLIALVKNASLFIGIDSGPSHFAAVLKVPAIIFFGAVNPWFRHFKPGFNGIIMQQPCEYAGCYHSEPVNISGRPCLLVGDAGIPKCSVHTNVELIQNINLLLPAPVVQ